MNKGEGGKTGPTPGGPEKEARRVVRRAALSAAAAGASPVRLGGLAGVPAVQARMLVQVAKVFGRPMRLREARDLVGLLGGATALRALGQGLARVACRAAPAVGLAAGAASAFGSTWALGHVAIRYFRAGERPGGDAGGLPGSAEWEREARALELEWESGAITEEVYRRDLEALREKFSSPRQDPR